MPMYGTSGSVAPPASPPALRGPEPAPLADGSHPSTPIHNTLRHATEGPPCRAPQRHDRAGDDQGIARLATSHPAASLRAARQHRRTATRIERSLVTLVDILRQPGPLAGTVLNRAKTCLKSLSQDALALGAGAPLQALQAAEAVFHPALRSRLCLLQTAELRRLSHDVVARPEALQQLLGSQPGKVRAVASEVVDLLGVLAVDELASRLATEPLSVLVSAANPSAAAPAARAGALPQLLAIARGLASADLPLSRVMGLMLDTLSDIDLGWLTADAMSTCVDDGAPCTSGTSGPPMAHAAPGAGPAAFMTPPASTAAATRAAGGQRLQRQWSVWRAALLAQLQRRKEQAAIRLVSVMRNADRLGSALDAAMRAAYAELEMRAITMTGGFSVSAELRTKLRDEALAQALRHLPAALRNVGLVKLPPRDLSSLRSSLAAAPADMGRDALVSSAVDEVCMALLALQTEAVASLLPALRAAVHAGDRASAVHQLEVLEPALVRLAGTQAAFHTGMPEPMQSELQEIVRTMRRLVCGRDTVAQDQRLDALSDAELGILRSAAKALAPYGTLVASATIKAEVRQRKSDTELAQDALARLIAAAGREDSTMSDVAAALRDTADALLAQAQRWLDLGEAGGADDRLEQVVTMTERVLARPDVQAMVRKSERIAMHARTLKEVLPWLLPAMAVYTGSLPDREAARWVPTMVILQLASYVIECLLRTIPAVNGEEAQEVPCDPHHIAGPDLLREDDDIGDASDLMDASGSAIPDIDGRARADSDINYFSDDSKNGYQDLDADANADRALRDALDALVCEFGIQADPAQMTARPRLGPRHLATLERFLIPPVGGEPSTTREILLPITAHSGQEPANTDRRAFIVDEIFVQEVLDRPDISISIEGVNARGSVVHRAAFDPSLTGEMRAAAVGAALHALWTLDADAAPALTRLINRRPQTAFLSALENLRDDPPIRDRDGWGIVPCGACRLHFHLRRQLDGAFRIQVRIAYPAMETAIRVRPNTGHGMGVELDATRSRVFLAFCLGADSAGNPMGMQHAIDLRYSLA